MSVLVADTTAVSGSSTVSYRLLKPVKSKKAIDIHLGEYSFFADDPAYHPEMDSYVSGVVGTPVPYTLSRDNAITGLLLGCFIIAMVALSFSARYLLRQVKGFFYMPRSVADMTETAYEIRFQYFLVLQTSLLLSIIYYVFQRFYMSDSDGLSDTPLKAIGIFMAVFVSYFLMKDVAYGLANWTFFNRKNNSQWFKIRLFLTSVEGVVLFPIVLLIVYFDLDFNIAAIYIVFVTILIKLLTFYKAFTIFFRSFGALLVEILYFCALELMPLMALVGILLIISNSLNVNI